MANECVPFHWPGEAITCHANVAVTGKRFVAVVGTRVDGTPRVGLPAAAARVLGVAVQDAAAGEKVGVLSTNGMIVPITAGAALVAGAAVGSDAAGAAIGAGAGPVAGYAIDDAALGAECPIQLRLA